MENVALNNKAPSLKTLDGKMFANIIRGGAYSLNANRHIVNDLNVFPIPDGDTGDNMSMTMDSGVAALCGSDRIGETASSAASGMLLGARGNSGVILSRIFAGISKGLENIDTADARVLGNALRCGISEAYSAVSKPVEGTILTVYKDAVEYACSQTDDSTTIAEYFDSFIKELKLSLERTPSLLDVLKKAGVVDSGGAGLVYIAEGMKTALGGNISYDGGNNAPSSKHLDFSAFDENSVLEFGYCTEFLLRLQTCKVDTESFDIEKLKNFLNSVGDSVVTFKDGSIVKVHVHTKCPGDILNHCQQFGEFLTLKIENMTLQHNETLVPDDDFAVKCDKPRKKYGIVSVAAGKGIKELFVSLGCDAVVEGGQSMNPSAEELIDAFRGVNAEKIFVYPNNRNIILTAQQAASLYDDAEICIIPSRTIGEGYAAISMLDTENDCAEDIISEQKDIIGEVVTGTVSQAVRDTEQDGICVHKDEYIGFVDETILNGEDNRNDALYELSKKLGAGKYDIIIVICGESVTPQESDDIYQRFRLAYSRSDVIMIDGGQPVYDYILVLE